MSEVDPNGRCSGWLVVHCCQVVGCKVPAMSAVCWLLLAPTGDTLAHAAVRGLDAVPCARMQAVLVCTHQRVRPRQCHLLAATCS
jgi:hypothetical protein